MAGFFFNDQVATPESIASRRLLLNALQRENLSTAPVGHWTQAIARALGSAADNFENAKLSANEKKLTDENAAAFLSALGGGSSPPAASSAGAGVSPPSPAPVAAATTAANIPASIIQSESGGNWNAQNNAMGAGGMPGHFGRLQFGQARLQDAIRAGAIPAGTTPQQFMASPELQRAAEQWHFADIDKAIASGPAAAAIGRAIGGVPVTQDGLRAVAHLGGVGGMNKFVQSNGAYNPADANGTTLMAYLQRHGGGTPAAAPAAPAGGGSPVPAPAQSPQTAALLQALSSPWAARNPMLAQLGQRVLGEQLTGNKLTYQTLSDGTIIALDPSGRRPPTPVYQAPTKPQWGVIGERDGEKQYGFIDPSKQSVNPYGGAAPNQPPQPVNIPGVGQVTPPTGKKAREAFDEEVGKQTAKSAIAAPQAIENANNALSVLDQLEKHPGLPRILGLTGKFPSAPGGNAADAEAILGQIKGKAFLQAFDTLKGGGQITEVEGQKATEAIARLNQNQSEKAFRESLAELRGIMERGLSRARAQGQVPAPPAAATAPKPPPKGPPQAGQIEDGYRFKGGNPADPKNWEKAQ
jgi:hypothetical protein